MTWTAATLEAHKPCLDALAAPLVEGKAPANILASDLHRGDIVLPAGFLITNPCASTTDCCEDERIVVGVFPGEVGHRVRLREGDHLTVLR